MILNIRYSVTTIRQQEARLSTRTKPRARRGVGRPPGGEHVREAILAAALRQLEASGGVDSLDRVTVAAIVEEAGCTAPSLYHYWPKRELLLHEASVLGWAQFRASQSGAVTDHDDPVERLRARGRAYLDFSLARPALFRVLFLESPIAQRTEPPTDTGKDVTETGKDVTETGKDVTETGKGLPQTGNALNDLVADVAAAMASGQLRAADPLTTALALWSAMHGVAALWAVTPNLPASLAHAVGELAQNAVISGLASGP